jgi:hypothetical protein
VCTKIFQSFEQKIIFTRLCEEFYPEKKMREALKNIYFKLNE